MSKKSKMLAIGKVFVTCLLLVFTAINLNAQLVTNGSFEATDLGVVSGRDVDGWVIEKLAGSADFENSATCTYLDKPAFHISTGHCSRFTGFKTAIGN